MSTRAQAVLALTLLCAGLGCWGGQPDPSTQEPPQVDPERKRVSIPVVLQLKAFAKSDPPGHHLVTWKRGRAGGKALLRTPTSDTQILDSLEQLGAVPGDTLSEAGWTYRDDPERPEPDAHATGTALRVTCTLPDGSEVPIQDLLQDVDGRGFSWVLAGNRGLIPVWKSGCVICLQSCPGSKVANKNATIRDLAQGRSRFTPSELAQRVGDGAKLTVHFELSE